MFLAPVYLCKVMLVITINGIGMKFPWDSLILQFICAIFIILFIYTGLNKIIDAEKFRFEIGRSPFVTNFSDQIAYLLPPGELVLSVLLIVRRTRLLGLYLSFALMALFTGYIWLMLHYAPDLPCSCGGIISALSWRGHFVFNSVFTALAVCGVFLVKNNPSRKYAQ